MPSALWRGVIVVGTRREGLTLEYKTGKYYEEDGQLNQLSGNIGLPLTDDGFLNLSFKYSDQDATDRSEQSADASGTEDVPRPATAFGQPEVSDDYKFFFNSAVGLRESMELYNFGNYAERTVASDFFYRNPNDRFDIFTHGPPNLPPFRLVLDTSPDRSGDCPLGLQSPGAVPDDESTADADRAVLAALGANPNCFTRNETFPNGYT